MELAAHDLLGFDTINNLLSDEPLPFWALDTLKESFLAVVRRDAHYKKNRIPVGLRGIERGQRFAAWIDDQHITKVISPMSLTDPLSWKMKYNGRMPNPVKTLIAITSLMNQRLDSLWGPAGSVAYELATGYKSIKDTSDLDLVIRTSKRISIGEAKDLLNDIQNLSSSRLDIQLDTPKGGVSLVEYTRSDKILIKTNHGPFLHDARTLWSK
ncbi:malonate decarboxylase holo-ACP synthase [Chryseobacterium sp. JAH]|uniref:malonate decarboxylase holo-ACP synthase n=1 Tax=Chryseobacterium sp. JAH TaxID=1742858 RepID=UPI000741160B|nr:malonate decarboxylase holo-ACP synthase [Chryseobacterium sp. JAH]KUJ50021.1 hypothetical protein AR685_16665 [Chryseobacterium sp. JAH]